MDPKKATKNPKRVAAKGFKLPDPISPGQILVDLTKKKWKIGNSIGQGGFGEIYLASDDVQKPVSVDANFVVKIEPHSNGPLFTEMHCYMRIAKPEMIEAWIRVKKLKSFGMPKYLGSGSLEYNGQKYRFMVMERFGMDLQKIIEQHRKQFSYKTVVQVAMQVIEVLEYIHHHEYIHADIKASNLLVGFKPGTQHQIYLVDYGLACRYMTEGKHKEYKYDGRKAHDGTIEFTSRDAHIGAHSRRGDMEILGYNLISWLCGKLPWENNLKDCDYVATQKRGYMDDIPKLMKKCFQDTIPPGIQEYMEYISSMTFDEKPNYEKCRNILRDGLKSKGYKEDKLVFLSATPKAQTKIPTSRLDKRKKAEKRREEEENIISGKTPMKKMCVAPSRIPCKPRNLNRKILDKEIEDLNVSSQDFVVDDEEVLIEKENLKMLAKKKKEKPKINSLKKDNAMNNPTPQMLEIMAKMREKSASPPACNKKHRHNGGCNISGRQSYVGDGTETNLTPEMEAVMKMLNKKKERTSRSSNKSKIRCGSPELFDSYEEDNSTVYFSPCRDCSHDNKSRKRLSRKRNISESSNRNEKVSKRKVDAKRIKALPIRMTRRSKPSPEV